MPAWTVIVVFIINRSPVVGIIVEEISYASTAPRSPTSAPPASSPPAAPALLFLLLLLVRLLGRFGEIDDQLGVAGSVISLLQSVKTSL